MWIQLPDHKPIYQRTKTFVDMADVSGGGRWVVVGGWWVVLGGTRPALGVFQSVHLAVGRFAIDWLNWLWIGFTF